MQKIHAALLVGGVSAGILLACYAFFFHGRIAGPEGDGVRWNELAISFASGTGLTPPNLPHVVDREPFYAVFAGTVYWFFGSHVSYVLLAQSALLVLALAALTWVLVPVMGVYAAAAVSLATIAAPGVASLAVGSLLAETVALTVSIAAYIVFTSILVRRDWYQGMFIGGVAFGALALTRYIFYPLPIFLVAGVLALKNRLGIENPGRIAVWLMAGFLVPVMLWTAYISMTLGVLAPVGTKGGAELALNMHRAQLSGKNLLAFTVGAVLGDAAGRFLFSGYAQNVEPYFTAGLVLKEYDENLIKDGQSVSVNASASRQAIRYMFLHPLRFGVVGVSEFFIRNSPMLWHNAADMRHLFAESHTEIPRWFRIASVALYRLVFIGVVLFALFVALYVLFRPGISAYLLFPAVAVLSVNALHFFFDSVPRHALPLYPFYFLLCAYGIRSAWLPRQLGTKSL